MKIQWRKLGLIFCPDGSGYFKSHATRPIPYRLDDNTLRLFYSSRDSDDRMLPTFIDVDVRIPSRVLRVSDQPLLGVGAPGTFDDSGLTIGSIVEVDGKTRIYYTGWKRRRLVPFELSIGIMIWNKKIDSCERLYQGPIIGQDKHHPLLVAGPFVLFDEGQFKMWYCSGTAWKRAQDSFEPIYTPFYATSKDGIDWVPRNEPIISYKYDGEVVSAPWVQKISDRYFMWYSTRGHETRAAKNYRIGFAESVDGISWERADEQAGITVSEFGWDSETVCYPAFYRYESRVYMFYSGNHVGRGGIGYAVAENFFD